MNMLRRKKRSICISLIIGVAILTFLHSCYISTDFRNGFGGNVSNNSGSDTIMIGSVICGRGQSQINLILTMIKSAILFRGKLHVHFLIVSDEDTKITMKTELENMKVKVKNVFTYEFRDLFFPTVNATFWRNWFKKCATARLFFPNIFPDVGKMVYVDMDTVFLNDLNDLWQHAYKMNKSQMIAGAPENFDPIKVQRASKNFGFPVNLAPSLNSGVLILDTKKMVEFGWYQYILKMAEIFLKVLRFPDQDLIRLFIMFHSDKFYYLSCKYNILTATCEVKTPCKDAVEHGIAILHGNARAYKKISVFRTIWEIFQKYNIGVDTKTHLMSAFENALQKMNKNNGLCNISTNVTSSNISRMLSRA